MYKLAHKKLSQKILKYFNDGNSLLDFYKLVVTVLKVKKKNVLPKITNYRDYR